MESLREKLIKINKLFSDGAIRYDGEFSALAWLLETELGVLDIAIIIARNHPFIDGNKRTAIKFVEDQTGEKVPEWIYEILKEA